MNHIHGEVAYESNYSPFNVIMGNSDEAEMLAQWFNGSHYFEQNVPIQPTFLPSGHEEINHCYSFLPSLSYESYANTEPMVDYSSVSQEQNFVSYLHVGDQGMQYTNQTMESDDAPLELLGHINAKRKLDMNCNDEIDIAPNKKSRRPMQISKKSKNEEAKEGSNGESSSGSSEDESNGELNASDNSKEKSKSRRGTATDPQSLYAKKRREKINLRLKTLQNLVPNGTKVDISTMLEEAVEYVKFLQLQIKLLSNDEQWMYAPIAYNGMNMSLDLNIN